MIKNYILKSLIIAITCFLPQQVLAGQDLTLLFSNDVHGEIEPCG